MICSNCGKNIPAAGKVCPWCHADKSKDQLIYGIALLCGFAGWMVGWMIHSCSGAFFGSLICMFVGMVTAYLVLDKSKAGQDDQ